MQSLKLYQIASVILAFDLGLQNIIPEYHIMIHDPHSVYSQFH